MPTDMNLNIPIHILPLNGQAYCSQRRHPLSVPQVQHAYGFVYMSSRTHFVELTFSQVAPLVRPAFVP